MPNKMYANNKTGLLGVTWRPDVWKWRAQIGSGVGGDPNWLGDFRYWRDAAEAYDRAALARFGPNAITNAKLGTLKIGPNSPVLEDDFDDVHLLDQEFDILMEVIQ